MKTLLITEFFWPEVGGSINWYLNTYQRYPQGDIFVLTNEIDSSFNNIPAVQKPAFSIYRAPFGVSSLTSLRSVLTLLKQAIIAARIIHQNGIEIVHCGKVLSEGFVALLLKYFLRKKYGWDRHLDKYESLIDID